MTRSLTWHDSQPQTACMPPGIQIESSASTSASPSSLLIGCQCSMIAAVHLVSSVELLGAMCGKPAGKVSCRGAKKLLWMCNVGVRKNSLMVLTHLIMNDMMKVKGHIARMALCLQDPHPRIKDLAHLFFHELSQKSYKVSVDAITLARDLCNDLMQPFLAQPQAK